MIRRSIAALVVLLSACASAPPAPPPDVPLDTFTYEVSVPFVPADASEVVLSMDLPGPTPVRVLSIRGLVGNAPFDVPLAHMRPSTFSNEHVSLSFEWTSHVVYSTPSLRLTTPGKPVELALRLGLPAGSGGAAELEQALVANTAVLGDGRAIEAVAKRFTPAR